MVEATKGDFSVSSACMKEILYIITSTYLIISTRTRKITIYTTTAMALLPSCLPRLHTLSHNLPKNHLAKAQNRGLINQKTGFSVLMCTKIPHQTDTRGSANYQPTIWTYNFIQSLQTDHLDEKYEKKVKKLEEEVRGVINDENAELLNLLELIDDIQRLGLGYRFQMDIRRVLDRIISWEEGYGVKAEKNLHVTALKFRLLRQHGYEISQDVFKTFNDQKGNYMAYLRDDVEGMLNLYEASHLAFEEENLLEEALTFSRKNLKEIKIEADPAMSELVRHALELPLHHRMSRLESRWYIEVYAKRKDANYVLLELAKLDFNWVQSVYQRDLKDMSRWWKKVDLANKLEFARDRLMECFFFMVGMVPEPQFSNCRKGLTKVFAFITIIDDIYDVYGTLEELEAFTDAVERWDINSINELPEYYMKICFLALYNSVNEMAYDTLNEQGENIIPHLKKAWADVCKAFLQEAKWRYNKYTPTFEDYLDNAWRSVSGTVLLVHSFFLLNQNMNKERLEYLEKYHNLLRYPSLIFRFCNDFSTSKAELERGETASSILCHMQETGQSEELAREKVRNLIDKTWKKMNKDRVHKHTFAEPFVETAINLARIAQCTYQYGDGHGDPDAKAKERILSLIIDPISVTEREVTSE